MYYRYTPINQLLVRLFSEHEVVGSNPVGTISKVLKGTSSSLAVRRIKGVVGEDRVRQICICWKVLLCRNNSCTELMFSVSKQAMLNKDSVYCSFSCTW